MPRAPAAPAGTATGAAGGARPSRICRASASVRASGATSSSIDSVRSNGEYVLLYPGPTGPIASARLEQIRDGIEDWDVLDIVRRRRGLSAVRTVLAGAGLFSATARGVTLACVKGCELSASTEFSWPQWSHDAATAVKIEAAKRRALVVAAG